MSGRWNVPNTLCALRLVGAPILVILAFRNETIAFAWLLAFLFLSDWLDGKLAILLDQRTEFGARLDTAADVAMYAALLTGAWRLKGDVVRAEAAWLVAAVASYGVAGLAGLVRWRRIPSYHTRAAKTCWLLVGVAAVAVFAGGPAWPLRVAMIAGVLTNVEGVLITLVLPRWETDVPSVLHALRRARGA